MKIAELTNRKNAAIAGVGLLALVAAYLGGRYSAPVRVEEKVRVETKIQTVTEWRDRTVEKRVAGPVRVRTVTIEKPGGERVIERVVDRGPVTTDRTTDGTAKSSTDAVSSAVSTKVTATGRPGWSLAVSAEADGLRSPDRYGFELRRRLVGTIWLGARASTDGTFGLAAALEW